jgi:hypothetical protein
VAQHYQDLAAAAVGGEMLTHEVKNTGETHATVEGLGVIAPGAVRVVDEAAHEQFKNSRGLNLAQARMPEGVEVAVMLTGKGGE